jgi:hypothetical protein
VLRVCGVSGLMLGVFYMGAGWSPVIYLAVIFITLAHLGGGAQWMLSTYGLQVRTPDHIRGRVMAGDYAIVTLIMSLSGLSAGVLSEAVGVRWTITALAGAGALASLAYLQWTRGIIGHLLEEESATTAVVSTA